MVFKGVYGVMALFCTSFGMELIMFQHFLFYFFLKLELWGKNIKNNFSQFLYIKDCLRSLKHLILSKFIRIVLNLWCKGSFWVWKLWVHRATTFLFLIFCLIKEHIIKKVFIMIVHDTAIPQMTVEFTLIFKSFLYPIHQYLC